MKGKVERKLDPFTTNRIAKILESKILERAEKEGHQVSVRLFLKKYLNEEITKETTESLAFGLGVLMRAGYMTEDEIMVIMRHLGVLIE